jgi:hypothetical protein
MQSKAAQSNTMNSTATQRQTNSINHGAALFNQLKRKMS